MKLVKAMPEAVTTLDPVDRLYPALLSATQAGDSLVCLGVTFQLLRAAPEIVTHAVVDVSEDNGDVSDTDNNNDTEDTGEPTRKKIKM